MWLGDKAGREFSKKPINIGELVYIEKGYFDTLIDDELFKKRLAVVCDVNPTAGTLDPMYDVVYFDKDGNLFTDIKKTLLFSYEQRIPCHCVWRAGLRHTHKNEKYFAEALKIKERFGTIYD